MTRLRERVLRAATVSSTQDGAPDSVRALRAEASAAQAQRQWARARDLWRDVVSQKPEDAGAWVQLGNMYNELAEYPAALTAFAEAARRDGASFDAVAGKAGVHERAAQWDAARDTWLQAVHLAEGNGRRLAHAYSHAILAAHLGSDDGLLSQITVRAIAACPGFLDDPDRLPLRAKLLRQGQPALAKQLLRERLQHHSKDDAARFEYASISLDDGEYRDGLAILEPARAARRGESSFLWLVADLYERLNHWHEVLDICTRVTEAGNTEARFARRGFQAAVRLGDLSAARRYARRYTAMSGTLEVMDLLRAAYEDAGELRHARLLCHWLAREWEHSDWHRGHVIKLTAATLGLLAADRLAQRTIAQDKRSTAVDRAYCDSAFVANEPAEAHRRLEWYLAETGTADIDAQVLLGYVLANAKGIDAAERHFLHLASSTFQTRGALVGLAHMASRRRDARATMECWTRVSAMYPEDTIARVERARALYDFGDHAGARLLCERTLRAVPSDTTMGEFYAWLLVATGDDGAAQAYLGELQQHNGPSWSALEAHVHSSGRLGRIEDDWPKICRWIPRASHRSASGRLYHVIRLLMYFEKPALAADLINKANIEPTHAAWMAPYCSQGHLAVEAGRLALAQARWRGVAAQVTDEPARRLAALPAEAVQNALLRPAHEHPRVHIINKFEQMRGGSELHALDLAERIGQHATVELWAPEMPHPGFSAGPGVQAIDRSQGRAPYGGVFVFVGIYFPIDWIAFAKPDRVIFLYNTFEAPTLYARVEEAWRLTGVAVELLFCSDLMGAECQLPGLFEPSPIDIDVFAPGPPKPGLPKPGLPKPGAPFTLGRHSRDVMEKHHPQDRAVYEAVTALGGRSLVLGGVCMRSGFLPNPGLDLLPARTTGIVDFLRSLDVFYYRTSTWVEPWGRVVVEAMACGVPVLVHDVGGYAQIIRHGENGLLFHTTAEATAQVSRLQADPALRQRLGKAGRATVESLLGKEALARLAMFYLLHPKAPAAG